MRIANLSGRLVIVSDGNAVDVETASGGRFSADPAAIYPRWAEFRGWADQTKLTDAHPFDPADLGAPSPAPRQLFAIGLNYRAHARETGFAIPEDPPVFTKYVTSITGPITEVALPENGHTDWEVELVVVVGNHAYQVPEARAWSHVAGLAVGQDISERIGQMKGPSPQFSLAKSHPGFTAFGPWLVTPDELELFALGDGRYNLSMVARVNGVERSRGNFRDIYYTFAQMIARASRDAALYPGDVLGSGTVGSGCLLELTAGQGPWLAEGDEIELEITGLGILRNQIV